MNHEQSRQSDDGQGQSDNELRYRFDDLHPDKNYNIHFTFWQPSGTGRIQFGGCVAKR